MNKWFALILILLFGCKYKPFSKDYIYTQSDDNLSLQEKVSLLKKSSSENDDALLASIASLYAQNKNWVDAKNSITKAIKLNPLDASYHLYLANYNVELNEPEQAYIEAKIANDLEAYDPKLEALLAHMAIKTKDTIEGGVFVRNYYNANPNNTSAKFLMARQLLFEKNYMGSYNLIQNALRKDSLNQDDLETAFALYSNIDSVSRAIAFGKRLIELDSLHVSYYDQLSDLYMLSGDNKLANHFHAISYTLKPDIGKLLGVIKYYENEQMYDSVLYFSDSTLAGTYSNDRSILLSRARAYDKTYKFDNSYEVYERMLKVDSTDSIAATEQASVQRKIAYLYRKRQEQKRLADSLANAMPTINF